MTFGVRVHSNYLQSTGGWGAMSNNIEAARVMTILDELLDSLRCVRSLSSRRSRPVLSLDAPLVPVLLGLPCKRAGWTRVQSSWGDTALLAAGASSSQPTHPDSQRAC